MNVDTGIWYIVRKWKKDVQVVGRVCTIASDQKAMTKEVEMFDLLNVQTEDSDVWNEQKKRKLKQNEDDVIVNTGDSESDKNEDDQEDFDEMLFG